MQQLTKRRIILIVLPLASILSISLFFILFVSLHHDSDTDSHTDKYSSPPQSISIQQACKATRYPDSCVSSLSNSNLSSNMEPVQAIQAAIVASQSSLKTSSHKLQALQKASAGNFNLTENVRLGLDALQYSEYRINSTAVAVPGGKIKTARALMSAGLGYQAGCLAGLGKYINASSMVNETMSVLNSSVGIASNALSMIRSYALFGNETGSWVGPKTERDGYWEGGFGSDTGAWNVEFPKGLEANVTVCKSGCDCWTVQEAVEKATDDSEHQFVISIKEGVYNETVRVGFKKKNVVFLGDGMGKTVITGWMHVGQFNVSTQNSATVGVLGDGFMASNLTIENTAGSEANQAVAFASDSDLSIIQNCEFLGHQDTLYANALRQYYKSCHIEGTVDFIFGNADSIFKDCTILVRPQQVDPDKGEQNAVAAHGRSDPAQATGFVFQDCVINGTDKYMELYSRNPKVHESYLARPWKEFSRVVYVSCVLESLINLQGWLIWKGDFALQTLYFGEFNSTGPGANPSGRVPWSSQIPADHVSPYSLQNFIQVDK
ncbi:putative pectinesterase/pectinesterase inhibitor 51 [Heracleum sosnowskyi]|uniref:Pectinesterase n=1 Tax=Heracleum sosnowskyi TaxID=360622 RepID=A0AAD8MTF4_9APIA|nr:putative pectinesterase/pectinesterase inhibitor 51 [Heracleum sosnowskyi]